MKKTSSLLIGVAVLSIVLSACTAATGGSSIPYVSVPAGRAYSEWKEIFFSHTETSDPGVAEKLTNMMKSPVLVVASLADVPDSALAPVFVFNNGIAGKGPLGFQPDVFPSPPGSAGYTPLRRIVFIHWADGVAPRELKSAAEVQAAEDAGEVSQDVSNVVVNMPFMVWDGGKR